MKILVLTQWIEGTDEEGRVSRTAKLDQDFPGLRWEDVTGQPTENLPTVGYLIEVKGIDSATSSAINGHPDYVVCREMHDDGTIIRDRLSAVVNRLSQSGVDVSDAHDIDEVRRRLRTLPKRER